MPRMKLSDLSYIIPIGIDKPNLHPDDIIHISWTNTHEASNSLSPTAFLLYMYLSLYDNQEICQFSIPDFCEATGLTDEVYADAYNELLDKNYLTPVTKDSNTLCFHDSPLHPPYLIYTGFNTWDEGSEDVW